MKLVPKFLDDRPVLFAIAFWILAVLLIAVVINWVAMPVIAGRFVRTLPVPDVVGTPAEQAETVLKEAGLNFKWASEGRYSGERVQRLVNPHDRKDRHDHHEIMGKDDGIAHHRTRRMHRERHASVLD